MLCDYYVLHIDICIINKVQKHYHLEEITYSLDNKFLSFFSDYLDLISGFGYFVIALSAYIITKKELIGCMMFSTLF